jgi:hypothetical protein
MKAIIETSYQLRGQRIGSYYSYPVYSDEIEATLIRQLEFFKRLGTPFSIELKIIEDYEK